MNTGHMQDPVCIIIAIQLKIHKTIFRLFEMFNIGESLPQAYAQQWRHIRGWGWNFSVSMRGFEGCVPQPVLSALHRMHAKRRKSPLVNYLRQRPTCLNKKLL